MEDFWNWLKISDPARGVVLGSFLAIALTILKEFVQWLSGVAYFWCCSSYRWWNSPKLETPRITIYLNGSNFPFPEIREIEKQKNGISGGDYGYLRVSLKNKGINPIINAVARTRFIEIKADNKWQTIFSDSLSLVWSHDGDEDGQRKPIRKEKTKTIHYRCVYNVDMIQFYYGQDHRIELKSQMIELTGYEKVFSQSGTYRFGFSVISENYKPCAYTVEFTINFETQTISILPCIKK